MKLEWTLSNCKFCNSEYSLCLNIDKCLLFKHKPNIVQNKLSIVPFQQSILLKIIRSATCKWSRMHRADDLLVNMAINNLWGSEPWMSALVSFTKTSNHINFWFRRDKLKIFGFLAIKLNCCFLFCHHHASFCVLSHFIWRCMRDCIISLWHHCFWLVVYILYMFWIVRH